LQQTEKGWFQVESGTANSRESPLTHGKNAKGGASFFQRRGEGRASQQQSTETHERGKGGKNVVCDLWGGKTGKK